MQFYYDPLDPRCKSITGALPTDASVTFRIFWSGAGAMPDHIDARFVLSRDGEDRQPISMDRCSDGYSVTLCFHSTGLYFYYFRIGDEFFGCGVMRHGCFMPQGSLESWQITVFDQRYKTPEWMKGGVMYQIFPDRFYKSGELPIGEGKILRSDWGGLPS